MKREVEDAPEQNVVTPERVKFQEYKSPPGVVIRIEPGDGDDKDLEIEVTVRSWSESREEMLMRASVGIDAALGWVGAQNG